VKLKCVSNCRSALEELPNDVLDIIFGHLDIHTIRTLRLVSWHVYAAATGRITHIAYDSRLDVTGLLQKRVPAWANLKTLDCTFTGAELKLFGLLNGIQVPKNVHLDLTTRKAIGCSGNLPKAPCNGLTGLTIRFKGCSALPELNHFTQLRRLELRPRLGPMDWPTYRVLSEMVSLTGLTELRWVDPGYGDPGPIEEGLLWLQHFTHLQVLCGACIWSADHVENLVALTSLTHLEFTLRTDEVSIAGLTNMSMLRKLGVQLDIPDQAELIDILAALTRVEDLTLMNYNKLGQLGSSLSNLTSLTLSSRSTWRDYLPDFARFNLRGLLRLSLRVNQSQTLFRKFSWSVLTVATQLKHLALDVRGASDPRRDMLVVVSQLTTLTHLELSLKPDLTVELMELAIWKVANLKRLSSLSLSNIQTVSLETLKGITTLTSLTELRIDSCSVTFGKGGNWLTHLTRLEVLDRPSHLFQQNAALLLPLWQFQYYRGMRLVNSCYADVLGRLRWFR
jgi:hypothetical protein